MDISHYDTLRHFADSWGLLYMMATFIAAILLIMRPGASDAARTAARIPLDDETPRPRNKP